MPSSVLQRNLEQGYPEPSKSQGWDCCTVSVTAKVLRAYSWCTTRVKFLHASMAYRIVWDPFFPSVPAACSRTLCQKMEVYSGHILIAWEASGNKGDFSERDKSLIHSFPDFTKQMKFTSSLTTYRYRLWIVFFTAFPAVAHDKSHNTHPAPLPCIYTAFDTLYYWPTIPHSTWIPNISINST